MVSRLKGPLQAYRIADSRHPIFDGTGASLNGGRWNSPGYRVIYASLSHAGAMLEILAHARIGKTPKTHASVAIHIPDDMEIERIAPDDVPGWGAPGESVSRGYGDSWLREKRTAVLIVPSILAAKHEANVLINPDHHDFRKIRAGKPEPAVWDERLLR